MPSTPSCERSATSYQRRPPRIAPAEPKTSSAIELRSTSMSRVLLPSSLHSPTTQSIESSDPAMKPSRDIVTCQITVLTVVRLLKSSGVETTNASNSDRSDDDARHGSNRFCVAGWSAQRRGRAVRLGEAHGWVSGAASALRGEGVPGRGRGAEVVGEQVHEAVGGDGALLAVAEVEP